ncbi:hypothetical protein Dform_01696 [Dehalogenimonas formicexedens]|uniref:Uncharacterized protein n=1 Tax=Dehalogenimonas formicexedens TaxID=1839801 RepID=A0A1P8F973_9CHLR|nr:hypothetical protein [Dehalogenimonas formicexedens]APV45016.1 hypothetical protein Dform_01696 [Dehalogenimonas formicexedens]
MKKWIAPATIPGKVSAIAILLFFPLFILSRTIRIVPREIPSNSSFFNEPITATLLILAWAAGTAAMVSGVWAVVKKRERAVPVFMAVFVGLFIFLFGAGEVISPH